MDKRNDKRFDKQFHVKVKSGSLISWGKISNISEKGLFIRSNRGFMIDSAVDIEILMPDQSTCTLKGIVRRIIEQPESVRKFGIGVELIEKDITYRHLLRSFNAQGRSTVYTLSGRCDNQEVF